jgi:N-acetylglucosaminyldiphosphoundecaprenol N-acetyl-beta-D-mannosaminyltransferase
MSEGARAVDLTAVDLTAVDCEWSEPPPAIDMLDQPNAGSGGRPVLLQHAAGGGVVASVVDDETVCALPGQANRGGPPQRVRLMGEMIDLVTPADVLSFAAERVKARIKGIVVNHNTHSLYLVQRDPKMRELYGRADVVEIDSTPLILWGRLTKKPIRLAHRSTYLDWREEFWRMASENRWRVFHLGGAPGVGERATAKIAQRWPNATIGTRHGYFDADPQSAENQQVVDEINRFRPDIVFVGMGMPRQESWIVDNFNRLHGGVVFSIGGAFDFEAGVQPTPPRWLGRVGLEWLFRFASQPRRLFARYFLEPWYLIPSVAADLRGTADGASRRPAREGSVRRASGSDSALLKPPFEQA